MKHEYYCSRCHSRDGFEWRKDELGELVETCKSCGAKDTKRDSSDDQLSKKDLIGAMSVYVDDGSPDGAA